MVDFVALAKKAKTLVEANGREVTFVRLDRTAGDVAQPWKGPAAAAAETKVKAIASFVEFDQRLIDGKLILVTDKRVLVAADSVPSSNLEEFSEIIDGADTWKIMSAELIRPADKRVLYDMQVRK